MLKVCLLHPLTVSAMRAGLSLNEPGRNASAETLPKTQSVTHIDM